MATTPRSGTARTRVCTGCYALTWCLLIAGCVVFHFALVEAIPHLKALPSNLRLGFDKVFRFDVFEEDAQAVKTAASDAVAKCGVDASSHCPSNIPNMPLDMKSTTIDEKDAIKAAFANSLTRVSRFANDPYFGTKEMTQTATDLENIESEMDKIKAKDEYCAVTNEIYCKIHGDAQSIVTEVTNIEDLLDSMTNHDMVKQFEEYSDYMMIMHALPYVLVLSALCYACFWGRGDATTCCSGGSKLGCIALLLHMLLWLVFFALATVIAGVGLGLKYGQDRIPLDFLKGKPDLETVLAHIKTEYPEFWNTVFDGLEGGLDMFLTSTIIFWAFCLYIAIYAWGVVCCRPYKLKNVDSKEGGTKEEAKEDLKKQEDVKEQGEVSV